MNLIKRDSSAASRFDPVLTDRLFDSFWRTIPAFPLLNLDVDINNGAIAPRINVVENEKNYYVSADMPGVPRENIDVSLEDGVLSIKAHVESESSKEEEGRIVHQERCETCYARRVDLGDDVIPEGLEASYRDGVLKITVPRKQGKISRPVKIQIR